MKQVMVQIKMSVPDGLSDARVSKLVSQMLDIGKTDAIETSEDPYLDNPDADQVASFGWNKPKITECKDGQ